jgi:hypothetical protein
VASSSATSALANGGNAPKAATTSSTSPVQTLAALTKGLFNLGKRTPGSAALRAQGRAGITRLQQAAARDSSPALNNVSGSGSQEALLSYLMGNG